MAWKEKEFEEKMRPYIDVIYQKTFKNISKILRVNREEKTNSKFMIMDRDLAIDTHLYFRDGTLLTFQEKTRQHIYQKYQDFTFEYQNDPQNNVPGEWFKLASQLYFFGYANEAQTGYLQWWILNVPRLRLFLLNVIGIETLKSKYLKPNKPPAKANFFAIPFNLLKTAEDAVVFLCQ